MPATDYRRRQAVMVSAGGHALRERARTDSDPVQIRELGGMERARVRAGGPSGIRELRERFESILSELAELRAHKGDAERAELELRNELETTRAQLSNAVTQLGTTRDQLTAARADADAARTDAAASTARAQRFEDRLAETMASAARAEHVEAELAQAVARAKRAEAQVEIALRSKPEPVTPRAVVKERVDREPAAAVRTPQIPAPEPAPSAPTAAVARKDVPASGASAPCAPRAFPGTDGPSEETPETGDPEAPRSTDYFDECMAELRELNTGLEEPSKDGRWGVGGS